MAVRAPHLYRSLRCFCLAGFSLLAADVEGGAEIPFSFEEHAARGNASLHEYRPLVRSYVDARGERLGALADANIVLEEAATASPAAINAAAHSGKGESSLLRTIALPLLADVAEACGGLDWSDEAFDRAYAELERTLLGERRTYAAVAPLVGVSVGAQVELAEGLRVRLAATGELAAHWPEASGLLPAEFGRAPTGSACSSWSGRSRPTCQSRPILPASWRRDQRTSSCDCRPIRRGPGALRAAGLASVRGEAGAADRGRGASWGADTARRLPGNGSLPTCSSASAAPRRIPSSPRRSTAGSFSLFADEPFRSEQLREALAALLGGADGLWAAAVRAAVLLGETRYRIGQSSSSGYEPWRAESRRRRGAEEAIRKALVEALAHGDRAVSWTRSTTR